MLNLNKCTKAKPKQHSSVRTAHVCVSLCTTVVHNTAQNSSDNLPSHPPDKTSSPPPAPSCVCVCVCEPWFTEHKAESLTRLSYSRSVDDRRQLLNVLSHHLTDTHTHTDIDTRTERQTERLSSTQWHCCVSLSMSLCTLVFNSSLWHQMAPLHAVTFLRRSFLCSWKIFTSLYDH